jgi:hypothetical protein
VAQNEKNYWITGTEKGQKRADKSSYEMRDTRYEIRDAKRAKKQRKADKGSERQIKAVKGSERQIRDEG